MCSCFVCFNRVLDLVAVCVFTCVCPCCCFRVVCCLYLFLCSCLGFRVFFCCYKICFVVCVCRPLFGFVGSLVFVRLFHPVLSESALLFCCFIVPPFVFIFLLFHDFIYPLFWLYFNRVSFILYNLVGRHGLVGRRGLVRVKQIALRAICLIKSNDKQPLRVARWF